MTLDPELEADTLRGLAARAELGRFLEEQKEEFASLGVQLGTRYEGSPIVWPDGTPEPASRHDVYLPTARPGALAPHLWLSQTESLFDALGPGFTLLRTRSGAASAEPLIAAAARRGIPLAVVDLAAPEARELYGSDLALIRPDQHMAWRGDTLPDPDDLLSRVTGGTL